MPPIIFHPKLQQTLIPPTNTIHKYEAETDLTASRQVAQSGLKLSLCELIFLPDLRRLSVMGLRLFSFALLRAQAVRVHLVVSA